MSYRSKRNCHLPFTAHAMRRASTTALDWKTSIAVAGLVLAAASGPARAAGDDRVTPVALAATAPGMIRTDTCTRPVYPAQEAGTNHRGVVTMRFLIGADGKVRQSLVVASSGYPTLDEAARTAIARCDFHPARADGKAVEAWVHVQYDWQAE